VGLSLNVIYESNAFVGTHTQGNHPTHEALSSGRAVNVQLRFIDVVFRGAIRHRQQHARQPACRLTSHKGLKIDIVPDELKHQSGFRESYDRGCHTAWRLSSFES
jgi:hypothetical protein